MLGFPDLFDFFKHVSKGRRSEDLVDRLNCVNTFFFLLLLATIVGTKQTFFKPIHCFAPAESTPSWIDYFNDYCFVQNKIVSFSNISETGSFERPADDKDNLILTHYQWIPYILLVQALGFLLPRYWWIFAANQFCNGNDIETIVEEACQVGSDPEEDQNKKIKAIAEFMEKWLALRTKKSLLGWTATLAYALRKWLALANVVIQFCFLAYIIPHRFNLFWAFQILSNRWYFLDEDVDPTQNLFPTIIRCDVPIQSAFDIVNPTKMPCVLTVNFINEKLFIIIYFWLLILTLINMASATKYTLLLISKTYRQRLAQSIFPTLNELLKTESSIAEFGINPNRIAVREHYDFFIQKTLNIDGLLLFLMLHVQHSGCSVFYLFRELWNACIKPDFPTAQESL